MQYNIDQFIEAVFGKAVQNFSILDLMQSKGNGGINWERVDDLYYMAERSLRDERFGFRYGRKKHSQSCLKGIEELEGV